IPSKSATRIRRNSSTTRSSRSATGPWIWASEGVAVWSMPSFDCAAGTGRAVAKMIERNSNRIASLREALEPFGGVAEIWIGGYDELKRPASDLRVTRDFAGPGQPVVNTQQLGRRPLPRPWRLTQQAFGDLAPT